MPPPSQSPSDHDPQNHDTQDLAERWRKTELRAVAAVQARTGAPAVVASAAAMGRFGDHAAGWMAIGALGALLDRPRRGAWATAGTAVLGAHAATVVVKRVLRRRRPDGDTITVHARTPSRLSFPSSHAASTTAAAVVYGHLLGVPAAPLVPAVMGASRLVLGLHFPTDVAAGTAVGAVAGRLGVAVIERGGQR